jgi:enoyl-CoA hydratase/carnithine racemase
MKNLRVETNGAAATVALDQPARRNALSPELLLDLSRTVRALSDRDDVRVVVLRGAGESPFSSGYDLTELPDRAVSPAEARTIHAPIRAAAEAITECRHPVVAAVRGFAFGAAVELVLSCDIRLASEETRFCIPATRWGFLYPYEGIRLFIEVLGASHATSLLLLGDIVPASRAYEIGLVHRVTPGDRFEAEIEAVVTTMVQSAPLAVRETKTLLQRARWDAQPSAAFLEEVYGRIAMCLSSQESRDRRHAR